MARRRHDPDTAPPHTPGRFRAIHTPRARPAWRVIDAAGNVVATIHTGSRAAGDARRIAAALNAVEHIATPVVEDGIVTQLLLCLREVLNLVAGVTPPGVNPPDYHAYVVARATHFLHAADLPQAAEPEAEQPPPDTTNPEE